MQYCEYYPEYDKCKQWLERNLPVEFAKIKLGNYGELNIGIRQGSNRKTVPIQLQRMALPKLAQERTRRSGRSEVVKGC